MSIGALELKVGLHQLQPGGLGMSESLQGKERFEFERDLLRLDMTPGENHVLLALLRYAGGKAECWPSNERLHEDTRLCVRQVRRHISSLARRGVVAIVTDRSIEVQRRIAFPSHPHASRGGVQYPPALKCREDMQDRGGRTSKVHAGGASVSPKSVSETPKETSVSRDGRTDGRSCSEGGGGEALDREKVLALVPRCPHLPHDTLEKLRGRTDLERKVEGDWRSLAMAIVKTQMGRADGTIQQAIRQPVAYLLKVVASIREGEDPGPGVRSRLDALLAGDDVETEPGREAAPARIPIWHIEQVMNPASLSFGLRREWMRLAGDGMATADIEESIRSEMEKTDDEYGLAEWQRSQRREVATKLFASMRCPGGPSLYAEPEPDDLEDAS